MVTIYRESLDGFYLLAFGKILDLQNTRSQRYIVNMNRAGSTLSDTATIFGTG